jgi:hypothetical protein
LEKDNSLDILGIKPIGNAVEKTTSKTLDGASAFLSRICLPAAEEFGLLLQDKVKSWRSNNAKKILEKAEEKLSKESELNDKKAHPLIVWKILENGSWCDHEELQSIWAGLLASSCDKTGQDDSNNMFINIISQLSEVQVKIINYACANATMKLTKTKIVRAEKLKIDVEDLKDITKIDCINRLDRELDYLRSISIINELEGGFDTEHLVANITPSDMAIQLFIRCQGFIGDPKEYFGL